MSLSMQSAAEIPLPDLIGVFNRAFDGYIGGTIQFTVGAFLVFLAREGIDLNLSGVVLRAGELVGFGLIARQSWTSRLAVMGIVPEAQGQGVGSWFLTQLIHQVRARGERAFVLEAFEQNTPAVQLYQNKGFRVVRRLIGCTAESLVGDPNAVQDWREIDVLDVAKLIISQGAPDLPWQIAGTSIARLGTPHVGCQCGSACAVITDPNRETIYLRALIVPTDQRRQGQATRLIHALAARYPGKKWAVPALCPEEYSVNFFEKIGFTREPLNQFQMELAIP